MLAALRETVVQAAVFEEDAADDTHLREEAHGAEDRGATGATAAVEEVVDGEMVGLLEDGSYDGASRRCNAMAASFELEGERFEIGPGAQLRGLSLPPQLPPADGVGSTGSRFAAR